MCSENVTMKDKTKKVLIVSGIVAICLVAVVSILARLSGQLLKTQIEKALGENVKASSVSISWGKVILEGLIFLRDGQTVGSVKSVTIKADFMSILGDNIMVSKVEVDQPYFKLTIDGKGKLLLPVTMPEEKAREERQKVRKKEGKEPRAKDTPPVQIKTITVSKGKVDFEDKSMTRPVALKFEDVNIDIHDIAYPFSNTWTTYRVSGYLTGARQKGSIHATGKTNFFSEETKLDMVTKNVDIVLLRPYVEKKGDVRIERGFITMNMNSSVVKNYITSPGKMVIRDLQLSSSGGIGGTFLGVPRSIVLSFLKDNNNEIVLDFVLEGDLNNPRFNIRENLATRLSVGLAKKLGVSILGIGEAVAGGSSTIIEGATRTLKGFFR
jgi:hypothetical protein